MTPGAHHSTRDPHRLLPLPLHPLLLAPLSPRGLRHVPRGVRHSRPGADRSRRLMTHRTRGAHHSRHDMQHRIPACNIRPAGRALQSGIAALQFAGQMLRPGSYVLCPKTEDAPEPPLMLQRRERQRDGAAFVLQGSAAGAQQRGAVLHPGSGASYSAGRVGGAGFPIVRRDSARAQGKVGTYP